MIWILRLLLTFQSVAVAGLGLTCPQSDGTMKSLVLLQYVIKLRRANRVSKMVQCSHTCLISRCRARNSKILTGRMRISPNRVGQLVPHRSLGHLYARTVEVLAQPHVQLVQAPQLQVGHGLLLVLDVARTELVRSPGHVVELRHDGG